MYAMQRGGLGQTVTPPEFPSWVDVAAAPIGSTLTDVSGVEWVKVDDDTLQMVQTMQTTGAGSGLFTGITMGGWLLIAALVFLPFLWEGRRGR